MLKYYIISLATLITGCTKQQPANSDPLPATTVYLRTVQVNNASQLKAALLDARPGDDIILADGTYTGNFEIGSATNGTNTQPIRLRGSRQAILDGGSIQTGYVLHVTADRWIIKGFTITNGLKGIMTDSADYVQIDSIRLTRIGEEAIHLRRFSTYNTVSRCDISYTGLKTPDYGEGIYIGSAKNNWPTYTNGWPDRSDNNIIRDNQVGPYITAECIDVKEGTTAGEVRNNIFDATGITGTNSADSWMDVKGNNWVIDGNRGFNPGGTIFRDGFQVHVAVSGWGNHNIFRNNQCTVNASGYGFNIQLSGSNGTSTGNTVYSNNTVSGAAAGVANITLTN